MIELVAKNVIIGSVIIIINLIPLITKEYDMLGVTAALSLLLAILGMNI